MVSEGPGVLRPSVDMTKIPYFWKKNSEEDRRNRKKLGERRDPQRSNDVPTHYTLRPPPSIDKAR